MVQLFAVQLLPHTRGFEIVGIYCRKPTRFESTLIAIGSDANGDPVSFPTYLAGQDLYRQRRFETQEEQSTTISLTARMSSAFRVEIGSALCLCSKRMTAFNIKIGVLLTLDGIVMRPEEVHRTVVPVEVAGLSRYD